MNIVFLGSKQIGFECLNILQNYCNQGVIHKIIGVITNQRGDQIKNYCDKSSIPILENLEEYLSLSHVDLVISVQYHELLKARHISHANLVVNLHMAPLPEYRGCNQFSLAILDDRDFFGTTIHAIDNGIDSGDILFENRFNIPKDIWVDELYQLTYDASIVLFQSSLPKLIKGDFTKVSQSTLLEERGSKISYRKDIIDLKKIDLSWDKTSIERVIRATSMPGFDPPYFYLNGVRVALDRYQQ